MGAAKRTLPPALAANRWRPGQWGNPSGHSGAYGEAMRLARQAAPDAVQRLRELAELDRIDERGNLIPLSELPDADRRVVAVACNALLDRAFGKPKEPRSTRSKIRGASSAGCHRTRCQTRSLPRSRPLQKPRKNDMNLSEERSSIRR